MAAPLTRPRRRGAPASDRAAAIAPPWRAPLEGGGSALPEEMPVNETVEFRGKLVAEMGMTIDRVVVNGLFPERFTAEGPTG